MLVNNCDTELDNQTLRNAMEELGLDVQAALPPSCPRGSHQEARRLQELYDWVQAYSTCPDRRELNRRGYSYPPLYPGFGPETDWLRFDRWVNGQALAWCYTERFGELAASETLDDDALAATLSQLRETLRTAGVTVSLMEGVPDRVAYDYLHTVLTESDFDYTGCGSFVVVTGCTGDCPGCFQAKWCPIGREACAAAP